MIVRYFNGETQSGHSSRLNNQETNSGNGRIFQYKNRDTSKNDSKLLTFIFIFISIFEIMLSPSDLYKFGNFSSKGSFFCR